MLTQTNNIDTFLSKDIKTESLIGEGLLDLGDTLLLVGPSEVGKSFFALQLAFDLATGRPFLGRYTVSRPTSVLLLQSEMSEGRYQERVRKLRRNYPDKYIPLELATTYIFRLDNDEDFAQLQDAIGAVNAEVLILDPLRPFFQGDENSSQVIDNLFHTIRALNQSKPITTILSHHESKPNADTFGRDLRAGKYKSRGSSVLTDRPGSVFRLEPTRDYETVRLVFEKTRSFDELKKPQPLTLIKDLDTGLFIPADDQETTKLRAKDLLDMLGGQEKEVGAFKAEIVKQFGVSIKTAEHKINELEAAGLVKKTTDPTDQRKRSIKVA